MSEYTGKTAIVTGAGWGIGYEICQQLLAHGANVILNDIDPERAEKARANLSKTHTGTARCLAVAGDAGDLSIIDQMIQMAIREFDGLHYVIANAGITTFGDFLDYQEEQFQNLVHINLSGSFFLCQKASKIMIENDIKGRLLVMSSVTGYQGHKGLTAYGMTKAALRAFARLAGIELAPHGLTINAIAPGATLTERTLEDPEYQQLWEELTPTGTVTRVEDIAHTALFLLSEKSHQITGQTIIVDGGWTATSLYKDE